jgi:hypothetical protein
LVTSSIQSRARILSAKAASMRAIIERDLFSASGWLEREFEATEIR